MCTSLCEFTSPLYCWSGSILAVIDLWPTRGRRGARQLEQPELPYVPVRFLFSMDVVNKATQKGMISALLLSIPYMSVFVCFLVCLSVFLQVYFSVGCCTLYSISLWQHGIPNHMLADEHNPTWTQLELTTIRKCKESISALVSYQTDRWLLVYIVHIAVFSLLNK